MSSDEGLCHTCQDLIRHLASVFEHFAKYSQLREKEGSTVPALPVKICNLDFKFVGRQGPCGLCERLRVARNQYHMSHLPDEQKYIVDCEEFDHPDDGQISAEQHDFLWACPYLECMRDSSSQEDGCKKISVYSSAGYDFLLLVVAPRWRRFQHASYMMNPIPGRRQPSFTAVQKISTTEELLYQPRTVSPLFDDKLASKWLHTCKTNHQESCGLPSPVDVAITLIDCFTHDIRPSRTSEKYAALSYVWGDTKQPPLDTLGRLPEDLSAVIKDAMAVTEALGLQYLWVDLYCIEQKDEAAKNRQMFHMSTIYQQAELTIVAACGVNAAHGLAGVGVSRTPTRSYQYGQYRFAKFNDPEINASESSAWNTRGWTLQESWLSRRTLCFTESQCYWECRGTCISEDLDHHEKAWTERRSQEPQQYLTTGPRNRNGFRRLNSGNQRLARYIFETQRVIGRFTRRQLTLDSDTLTAISGVLSVAHNDLFTPEEAQKQLHPGTLLGLTMFFGQGEDDPVRKITLIAALTWYHEGKSASRWLWAADREWPQRRRNFPSWTWAGWKGHTEFDEYWLKGEREWNVDFCVKNVELCDDENRAATTGSLQSTGNTARLRFSAPRIPAGWLSFQEDTRADDKGNPRYWCFLKNRKMKFSPSENDYHPAQISRDLLSGDCELVLVGFIKKRHVLIWLLRRESGALVRSGTVTGFSEKGESGLIDIVLNNEDCEDPSAMKLSEALDGLEDAIDWEIS